MGEPGVAVSSIPDTQSKSPGLGFTWKQCWKRHYIQVITYVDLNFLNCIIVYSLVTLVDSVKQHRARLVLGWVIN